MKRLVLFLAALLPLSVAAERLALSADKLASLIDPAKLGTLRERGANPRIQKAVAILADSEADKVDPGAVCAAAVMRVS